MTGPWLYCTIKIHITFQRQKQIMKQLNNFLYWLHIGNDNGLICQLENMLLKLISPLFNVALRKVKVPYVAHITFMTVI